MPPVPKDPKLRQRKNKVTTAATLVETSNRALKPKLPARPDGEPWNKRTVEFWRWTWSSPMATEYVQADVPGLERLAMLIDEFWRKPTASLSAEIRLVGQNYGLSPLDRRRLQWEVKRVEGEKQKRKPSEPQAKRKDPRIALGELRAVK